MKYWGYENWKADGHRITVHKTGCGHRDKYKGNVSPNGQWHDLGTHESKDQALTAARLAVPPGVKTRMGECCD